MKLEKIEEKDLKFLAEIFQVVFQKEPWKEAWNTASAYQHLSVLYHSAGFIGYKAYDDTLIGFVMGQLDPCYDGLLCWIKELCICLNAQHKGYGKKILSLLEEQLISQNVQGVLLWTHHDLEAFYATLGYQVDTDLTIMKKVIQV